jgi:hypothetical protein
MMDDDYASSLYYVITPLPEHRVRVMAFRLITDAERYRAARMGPAHLIRHSRKQVAGLPMDILVGIVQAADPSIKATSLGRDELARVAFGCLWAAYFATRELNISGAFPITEDSMSTTVGKGPKVREIRSEAKAKRTAASKKSAAAPKAAKKASGGPAAGPRANDPLAGKKITLVGKENPRREGTHGYRSMEVVRNAPGIRYEDYINKGGRRVDLQGSIDLKQVEISD